jgi:hypothetical protein
MKNLMILAGVVLGATAVISYLFKFGISHVIDARPGDHGIYFILFTKIKIYVLQYDLIEGCGVYGIFDLSWSDGNIWSGWRVLHIGGRPGMTRVILKMKRGPVSYVSLFPRNPSDFAKQVQKHSGVMRSR